MSAFETAIGVPNYPAHQAAYITTIEATYSAAHTAAVQTTYLPAIFPALMSTELPTLTTAEFASNVTAIKSSILAGFIILKIKISLLRFFSNYI